MAVTECTGQGWFVNDYGQGHGAWANGQNIGSIGKEIKSPENPAVVLPVPAINMRSDLLLPAEELAWENEQPRSDHPGGVNALMCDGSVRFVEDTIQVEVLLSLASRNGCEQLPNAWDR